jgi:hypothetical protein
LGIVGGGVLIIALLIIIAIVLREPDDVPKPVCHGCGRIMKPDWARCLFCGWAPQGSSPRLEFICGPLTGQNFQLTEDITTIGSVAGNTIVLSDPAVSRKHLGIRRNGEAYEFADLGSTNGVYINGQRMPRKQLASGDVLRVGNTEIVFRVG